MNILIVREEFFSDTTIGKLYIDGKFFCHTLEDAVRGFGIKIDGITSVPSGGYYVSLTESTRFKRLMPMVYTENNGYELKAGGISFKGIRMHGGNTHKNTEGCILVAHNRVSSKVIQGTAEKDLVNVLKNSYEDKHLLVIKNK